VTIKRRQKPATEQTETGPRWAWDFVQPTERGGSVLVESRAENEDDPEAIPGTTLFVASTDTPDRAMDVVSQNWKLRAFRDNPVILDNHDHRRVVGHAVSVKVPKVGPDAGKLMIRVAWDIESPDPSIRNVGHQHLNGIRRAGSVGFRSTKTTRRDKLAPDHAYYQAPVEVETWWGTEMLAGKLYEGPELLEFSSATVPMNAEALQRSLVGTSRAELEDPAEGDPSPPAEDDTPVPEFLTLLADDGVRGQFVDLVWPDLATRFAELLAPPEPESADEEPEAAKAFRAAILRVLRTNEARRLLKAALDQGPPARTATATPFLSLLARELETP
jgi:hypothetical protein